MSQMVNAEVFREHLLKMRRETREIEHQLVMTLKEPSDLMRLSNAAHQAELLSRLISDLDQLEKDEAKFIETFLKED